MATLIIDAGETVPDMPGSRFGGLPLVPDGFDWPVCHTCKNLLQFVGQLDLPQWPDDVRLMAIFMCNSAPGTCETWSPITGANQALVFTGGLRPTAAPILLDAENELVRPATAVRLVSVEPAAGEDEDDEYWLSQMAWKARHQEEAPRVLGQFGGRPSWLQAPETPHCPSCYRPMTFAAQLEEHGANFGTGEAFAFHCIACHTGSFLWQC
ncbi:DUF1963 domain-containing protein [Kineosporia babensis]|uniref:DUF1963 domain-containing protein n=1 Tax=Kineosporia babensis TaxID=499548 RepID=A0A9X1NHK5_9ACTN|nr:DUF1963 domain-containing protein [Kineosporia babensis]MCD5313248.1 DUF1963 domain-containing protein [Kineosporia babensis]